MFFRTIKRAFADKIKGLSFQKVTIMLLCSPYNILMITFRLISKKQYFCLSGGTEPSLF